MIERPRWFDLFRCFRLAADPGKVCLAFIGLAYGVLMSVLAFGIMLEVRNLTGGTVSREALGHVRAGDGVALVQTIHRGLSQTAQDLRGDWADIRDSLWTADLMAALERASTLRKVFCCGLIFLLLISLPWAYYGGAVSRAAAVEYASGERLTSVEAREFAAARWSSYFWAPIALIAVIAVLLLAGILIGRACSHLLAAVVLVLGAFGSLFLLVATKQKTESGLKGGLAGLLGLLVTVLLVWLLWGVRLPWLGRVAVVLVFPVLFLLAAGAVLTFLVLLFGRGMMSSAVSFEGTDAFDAMSRAADYVCRRPWRLAFCTVVGLLYAVPCAAVVVFVVAAAFFVAVLAAWAGFGAGFQALYDVLFAFGKGAGLLERIPAFLLWALVCVLGGLLAAWALAFIQSLRAVTYALIRRSVDLSETCEIYVDADRLPEHPSGAQAAGTDSASPPTQ